MARPPCLAASDKRIPMIVFLLSEDMDPGVLEQVLRAFAPISTAR